MNRDLQISAVLPCFEEASWLPTVVEQVRTALQALAENRWEIVLVTSDESQDGTRRVAHDLAACDSNIKVLVQTLAEPGYGRAVRLGIKEASFPWIFLIDSDGQFDPSELMAFSKATKNADIILGYRNPRSDAMTRRIAGRIYTAIVGLLAGTPAVRDLDCAFKLFRREILHADSLRSSTGVINAELLSQACSNGARIAQAPVSHRPRLGGSSRFENKVIPSIHLPEAGTILNIALDTLLLLSRRLWPMKEKSR